MLGTGLTQPLTFAGEPLACSFGGGFDIIDSAHLVVAIRELSK